VHFCYPSGFWLDHYPAWLRQRGIVSAATSDLGIASQASNPLLLPRLLDMKALREEEFDAWLMGIPGLWPRRVAAAGNERLCTEQEQLPAAGARTRLFRST
jgi:hypothetical protein